MKSTGFGIRSGNGCTEPVSDRLERSTKERERERETQISDALTSVQRNELHARPSLGPVIDNLACLHEYACAGKGRWSEASSEHRRSWHQFHFFFKEYFPPLSSSPSPIRCQCRRRMEKEQQQQQLTYTPALNLYAASSSVVQCQVLFQFRVFFFSVILSLVYFAVAKRDGG